MGINVLLPPFSKVLAVQTPTADASCSPVATLGLLQAGIVGTNLLLLA
jgi:hypothetical protein